MKLSENFIIERDHFVGRRSGKRVALIGTSGAGKSNTLDRMRSGWSEFGFPYLLIDPMGQFAEQVQDAVIAGNDEACDVVLTTANASALAKVMLEERFSVIIDVSMYGEEEMMDVLERFLKTFWDIIFRNKDSQPFGLFIDEAHELVPQIGATPLSKIIIDIAKRGRHRNLTSVLATQRAASLDKNYLTQVSMLVAHQLSLPVDMAVLYDMIDASRKSITSMMRGLAKGEAIILGEQAMIGTIDYRREQILLSDMIRNEMDENYVVDASARQIDDSIRDALKRLSELSDAPVEDPELKKLRDELKDAREQLEDQKLKYDTQIGDLQTKLAVSAKRAERLESQVEMLSKIKITVEPVAQNDMAAIKSVTIEDVAAKQVKVDKIVTNGHLRRKKAIQPVLMDDLPMFPNGEQDQPDEDYRSPVAEKRAINRQRRNYDGLIENIQRLPPKTQKSLGFLIEQHGRSCEPSDIARNTQLSESSLRLVPLMEMGLVDRKGKPGKYVYHETVREHFAEQFPDLDQPALIDGLLGVLPM